MAQNSIVLPRVVIPILLVVLVAAGVGGYVVWQRYLRLPPRGSPQYVKYVEAFQVGVAALDLGGADDSKDSAKTLDNEIVNLAEGKLTEAINTIPGEPAAWA